MEGTPRGAGINPLLANIFLHYVLDLWESSGSDGTRAATFDWSGTRRLHFGISGNSRALGRFRLQVMKARRVLLRRSQRLKLSWERSNALLQVFSLPFGRMHGWRQQMA